MKTNKFWFATAAAALVTVIGVFTSCSKEDEPFLPEVIESEVLEAGLSNEVNEVSGTEGTKLSYESWIVVKGQTRAAFENKVSVTLCNQLNNLETEIDVKEFNFGQVRTSITYGVGDGSRTDGFVQITDSVMFYNVEYDNFSFAFELPFEVAVYNDKVTRQVMPYHRYGNIVDKGSSVKDLEIEVEDIGKWQNVRVRKLYQHDISVDFNGKSYDLTAKIILKKTLQTNGENTVLKCELIDSGTEVLLNEESSTMYKSWIKVKQTMLNGSTREQTYTVDDMYGSLDHELLDFKKLQDKNIMQRNTSVIDVDDIVISAGDVVYVHKVERSYVVDYNYFSLNFKLLHHEAYYDDGITTIKFPFFKHENFADEGKLTFVGDFVDGGFEFSEYWFAHTMTADFGSVKHTGLRDFQVITPKQ